MLTGTVKSAFHAASAEMYEPACVVDRVAKGIRAFGHHHFITLICARVRDGSLDFVNAGHPSGILLNRAGAAGASRIDPDRSSHPPSNYLGARDDAGRAWRAIACFSLRTR